MSQTRAAQKRVLIALTVFNGYGARNQQERKKAINAALSSGARRDEVCQLILGEMTKVDLKLLIMALREDHLEACNPDRTCRRVILRWNLLKEICRIEKRGIRK